MALFRDFLAKAKALTSQGKVMEATQAIQNGLGFGLESTLRAKSPSSAEPHEASPTVDHPARPEPPHFGSDADITDLPFRETARPSTEFVSGRETRQPTPASPAGSSFEHGTFGFGASRYDYRLFIPSRIDASPLPLVVMLHGCKQNSDDFAKGTAMNAVAERQKFMVLYPEQLRKSNSMGCWNWFDPAHQSGENGEPAMIAALSAEVITRHQADSSKVYVAGLSAGAAMAALVGQLYPEIFAAVGVHSGLAPGSARDVASAFSAMSRGPTGATRVGVIGVPVIVFHGTGDATVSPGNADAIVNAELAFWSSKGVALEKTTGNENPMGASRPSSKTVWTNQSGKAIVERWSVSAGPHAWSGGDSAGSFTDPKGPSASEAMVAFFMKHNQTC